MASRTCSRSVSAVQYWHSVLRRVGVGAQCTLSTLVVTGPIGPVHICRQCVLTPRSRAVGADIVDIGSDSRRVHCVQSEMGPKQFTSATAAMVWGAVNPRQCRRGGGGNATSPRCCFSLIMGKTRMLQILIRSVQIVQSHAQLGYC